MYLHFGGHVLRYQSTTYLLLVRPSNFDPSHILEGCDLELHILVFINVPCLSLLPGSGFHFELTLFVTSPHVASEYRLLVRPSIIDPSHTTVGCDLVFLLRNPTLLSCFEPTPASVTDPLVCPRRHRGLRSCRSSHFDLNSALLSSFVLSQLWWPVSCEY